MNFSKLINCSTPEEVRKAILKWTSKLSEKDHLIKAAILEIHANLEELLKDILYEILLDSLPYTADNKEYENNKKNLQKKTSKLSFSLVYNLLKPALDAFNSKDLNNINEINQVRNLCVHGNIEKVLYKNRNPFKNHDCLAQIFFESWAAGEKLNKYFEVVIDSKRYEFEYLLKYYKEHNK